MLNYRAPTFDTFFVSLCLSNDSETDRVLRSTKTDVSPQPSGIKIPVLFEVIYLQFCTQKFLFIIIVFSRTNLSSGCESNYCFWLLRLSVLNYFGGACNFAPKSSCLLLSFSVERTCPRAASQIIVFGYCDCQF